MSTASFVTCSQDGSGYIDGKFSLLLDKLEAEGSAEPGDTQKQCSTYSFGAVFAELHLNPGFGVLRAPRKFWVLITPGA